jgi:hypothetical protein
VVANVLPVGVAAALLARHFRWETLPPGGRLPNLKNFIAERGQDSASALATCTPNEPATGRRNRPPLAIGICGQLPIRAPVLSQHRVRAALPACCERVNAFLLSYRNGLGRQTRWAAAIAEHLADHLHTGRDGGN